MWCSFFHSFIYSDRFWAPVMSQAQCFVLGIKRWVGQIFYPRKRIYLSETLHLHNLHISNFGEGVDFFQLFCTIDAVSIMKDAVLFFYGLFLFLWICSWKWDYTGSGDLIFLDLCHISSPCVRFQKGRGWTVALAWCLTLCLCLLKSCIDGQEPFYLSLWPSTGPGTW